MNAIRKVMSNVITKYKITFLFRFVFHLLWLLLRMTYPFNYGFVLLPMLLGCCDELFSIRLKKVGKPEEKEDVNPCFHS